MPLTKCENAAGCCSAQAPPTPDIRSNNVLQETLNGYLGEDKRTNFDKFSSQLPASLAFRTSSQQQAVSGMGAYIDARKMTVPKDPADMGMIMRNGRRERIDRDRRLGDPLMWETSSMRMSAYRNEPKSILFE